MDERKNEAKNEQTKNGKCQRKIKSFEWVLKYVSVFHHNKSKNSFGQVERTHVKVVQYFVSLFATPADDQHDKSFLFFRSLLPPHTATRNYFVKTGTDNGRNVKVIDLGGPASIRWECNELKENETSSAFVKSRGRAVYTKKM